jgi:hypothetical protein
MGMRGSITAKQRRVGANMAIEIDTLSSTQGKAYITTEQGDTHTLFLEKLRVYESNEDNNSDPFVPYTFTLRIGGLFCNKHPNTVANLRSEIDEAAKMLLSRPEYPFRALFITLGDDYTYQDQLDSFNTAADQFNCIVYNHEETINITQKWSRFQERFHDHRVWIKCILVVKREHNSQYMENWIDTTRQLR